MNIQNFDLGSLDLNRLGAALDAHFSSDQSAPATPVSPARESSGDQFETAEAPPGFLAIGPGDWAEMSAKLEDGEMPWQLTLNMMFSVHDFLADFGEARDRMS